MKIPVIGRISPVPLARFRVAFGVVLLFHLLSLRPDWLVFFGPRGLVTWDTTRTLYGHNFFSYVNLFAYLPNDDGSALLLFWLLVASSIGLALGFLTRLSNFILMIGLTSIQMRNPYICNGADHLARLLAFYLLFSPAGEAISVDRLWGDWRGKGRVVPNSVLPWCQWMVQLQICIVYLSAGFEKLGQERWLDGSALYFLLRREEFIRLGSF